MGTGALPLGEKRPRRELTTHLHLVSRSRMRGAVHPLPQYAIMAWCSVNLLLLYLLCSLHALYTYVTTMHFMHHHLEMMFSDLSISLK